MAQVRFSRQQIDRFNDRIRNCLEHEQCRKIFERYLNISKKYVLLKAFKLWETANSTVEYDDEEFLDLIEEVTGFNTDPLLTISEKEEKLAYIKMATCNILEPIHRPFIEYLSVNHMS